MLDTLINDYNNIYRYELKGRIPAKKDSQRIFKNKKGKSFITSSQSHSVWEPEAIQKALGMSKKQFKQCIGQLYKAQEITIHADGISLSKD